MHKINKEYYVYTNTTVGGLIVLKVLV